ncbi:MAG: hypothetical protein JEY97_05625 [Bacteroidales bacterium]|nr:hypothetical protein [Bacteroidales bacterium]
MLPDINIVKGIHPGIILERELKKRKIRKSQLAGELGISSGIITDIAKTRRGINPALSIRLGSFFDISEEYFILLQTYYALKQEQKKQIKHINLSLRSSLFWDINFENIDYERNKSFVITRVFERGNKKEIQNIIDFYGKEEVSQEIKSAKSLLFIAIENAMEFLEINRKEFKCLQNSTYKQYQTAYI